MHQNHGSEILPKTHNTRLRQAEGDSLTPLKPSGLWPTEPNSNRPLGLSRPEKT